MHTCVHAIYSYATLSIRSNKSLSAFSLDPVGVEEKDEEESIDKESLRATVQQTQYHTMLLNKTVRQKNRKARGYNLGRGETLDNPSVP